MESESNTDTETSRCGVWTPCPAEVNQSEPADFDLDIRLSPTRPQTSVLKLIEWNEIPHKRLVQDIRYEGNKRSLIYPVPFPPPFLSGVAKLIFKVW